jgi:anti-sigma regulatory factor (Ser/Thr protein kinase)
MVFVASGGHTVTFDEVSSDLWEVLLLSRSGPAATVRLQPTLDAPARARRAVREAAAGLPAELVADAALLTSEVVTNAVLHTGGILTMVVERREGAICVAVTDASTEHPRPDAALPALAARGRGLQLVANLADRWGCKPTADGNGKVVWFRLGG